MIKKGNHSCLAGGRIWAVVVCISASFMILGGCTQYEQLKAAARISPFVGRGDAAKNGAGGYVVEGNEDVKELRLTNARPVDLDRLTLPDQVPLNLPPSTVGASAPGTPPAGGTPPSTSIAPDAKKSAPPVTAYEAAAGDPKMRNRLGYYLLRVSDDVCLVHKSDILAVSSAINASLSGVTSVLGGLGAIVTGATAARALAGSAAISNALREDVNQNIYYNNFASAIVKQIDLQRQQKLQQMEPRLSDGIDAYSVDAMIRDIGEYHALCSFSVAVAALADQTKRPSTADELRGKIDTLRNEYSKNLTLINDKSTPKATGKLLSNANDSIARMIQVLTLQLGLAQDAPTTPSPPTDSSTPGAAGNPGADSKPNDPAIKPPAKKKTP